MKKLYITPQGEWLNREGINITIDLNCTGKRRLLEIYKAYHYYQYASVKHLIDNTSLDILKSPLKYYGTLLGYFEIYSYYMAIEITKYLLNIGVKFLGYPCPEECINYPQTLWLFKERVVTPMLSARMVPRIGSRSFIRILPSELIRAVSDMLFIKITWNDEERKNNGFDVDDDSVSHEMAPANPFWGDMQNWGDELDNFE